MVACKSFFPLIFIFALLMFEERVSIPACQIVPRGNDDTEEHQVESEDLRVMMVTNLLLLGSEAGYANRYFRDSFTAKFFKKSFQRLKPDMLIVLGDFSAKGSDLTTNMWSSVLQQFQMMLGPFIALPLHIVLGDREVGECSKLNVKSIAWIARNLPGLDSAGCAAFEVSNISFVSLNAVAMLCGNNDLRFSVEKVIEKESLNLQTHSDSTKSNKGHRESFSKSGWRENDMTSGSGPVLLLHFPLHRTANNNYVRNNVLHRAVSFKTYDNSKPLPHRGLASPGPYELLHTIPPNATEYIFQALKPRGLASPGPYELLHTIPPNATEYIFQALKPRIIFSAHAHEYNDYTHIDGTREVTVPAMTWDARDDPGFVVATFGKNGTVTVNQCSLARESRVVMFYVSIIVLIISTAVVSSNLQNSGR